jgi:hypothetical protein
MAENNWAKYDAAKGMARTASQKFNAAPSRRGAARAADLHEAAGRLAPDATKKVQHAQAARVMRTKSQDIRLPAQVRAPKKK